MHIILFPNPQQVTPITAIFLRVETSTKSSDWRFDNPEKIIPLGLVWMVSNLFLHIPQFIDFYLHVQSLSHVWLFATPWMVACQVSMRFSRQEYWSGLPRPPSGHLPDPGIKLIFPALAGRFFTTKPPGKQKLQ